MRRISNEQIVILRAVAVKVFGMCDESCKSGKARCDFHSWLDEQFFHFDPPQRRRRSTKQLTITEAATAINALLQRFPGSRKVGLHPPQSANYYGSGFAGSLTPSQADRIGELEAQLGWQENPERLLGFIRRQTKLIKSVEMLTNRQASKVITGLERLIKYLGLEIRS